jgi:hypothetical protein
MIGRMKRRRLLQVLLLLLRLLRLLLVANGHRNSCDYCGLHQRLWPRC